MIDFSKLTSEDLQAMIRKNVGEFFIDLAEGFQKAAQKEETEKVDYSAFALDPRDLDLAY
nr:MAG TPA: hypothetical protein [Caudoviricetes sp.]